jgi:class 3 adenylate cyclase
MTEIMQTSSEQSVLFSDIVGSSKLYQKLGNDGAENAIRFTISTLSDCAHKFNGRVIKTIGDEIMCAFPKLQNATDAATEMNSRTQESGIELRTGLSFGQLIERDGDLFGDVVNNAAFLTKVARAKEILIDETALDKSGAGAHKDFELIAEMTIKGQNEPCKIYRVNWEQRLSPSRSATVVDGVTYSSGENKARLRLQISGKEFTLNGEHPIFVAGREKSKVSMEINHSKVSRRHCTISLKQGKFILEDHSTNGTYVEHDDDRTTFVHRESYALIGSGSLKLGNSEADDQYQIHYEVA